MWRRNSSQLLGEDSAAEELGAVVERHDLAGGEGALGLGEFDLGAIIGLRHEIDGDARVAVTDAAFDAAGRRDGFADETETVNAALARPQAGCFGAVEGDEERVIVRAFAGDDVSFVVGVGGNADASALTDRVVMQTAVFAEDFAIGRTDDRAGAFGNVGGEEVGHLYLADETDSLAVFFGGGRELGVGGEGAEFGFGEMTNGKTSETKLFLRKQCEEVGLVFVGIEAFEKGVVGGNVTSGRVFSVQRARRSRSTSSRVVAGGEGGEAFGLGVVREYAEFHFAVAHHIGIGREAVLITVEQVIHDESAVIVHEIHDAEFDAELVGDGAGVVDVLHPRTIAEDIVLVDPVLHVRADDLEALLLEEKGGDTAVDAAGHGDEDAFHGG